MRQTEDQITLGQLIKFLESNIDSDGYVPNLMRPHAYRGDYNDLAFVFAEGSSSVKDMLSQLQACLCYDFIGRKGGTYTMTDDSLLWVCPEQWAIGIPLALGVQSQFQFGEIK